MTPIFDSLAEAYGDDGLIGWAFEDHGGPVSTAWTALTAALRDWGSVSGMAAV